MFTNLNNLAGRISHFCQKFLVSNTECAGMLINPCLIVLLLLAGSLVSKFHSQLTKKKLEESPGKGRTYSNLADGETALAQLYALYSHGARSFNQ